MSELNLNLNDGREKIYINKALYGEDRVIYLNLSDMNLLVRFKKAYGLINKKFEETKMDENNDEEKSFEIIESVDLFIREQIDYIFGENVSDVIFGKSCSVTPIDGMPYAIVFLNSIMPLLEEKTKHEYSKIKKYTDKYENQ